MLVLWSGILNCGWRMDGWKDEGDEVRWVEEERRRGEVEGAHGGYAHICSILGIGV